jgi:hypothetical protein
MGREGGAQICIPVMYPIGVNRAVASHGPLIVSTDEAPAPAAVIVPLHRRSKRAYLYLHNE